LELIVIPDTLSQVQYDTVYNFLSLVIASQLFTAVFLTISLPRVLPRYRQAITVAIVVCGIAAYHYFRIFDSFKDASSAPQPAEWVTTSTRATVTLTGS
jgi:NO-binding membrane sensor protein with MHYT domain